MKNLEHISESLKNNFGGKILKFFYADPGPGMEKTRIQDGINSDPGSGINIPDPQHCLHDERNGSFILIWKILSSFVKPGSGPSLGAILCCFAGGWALGSLPCMMNEMVQARIECNSGLYYRRVGAGQLALHDE